MEGIVSKRVDRPYQSGLTAVGFLFAAVEFARTQRMLDTEEWGRATRRGLIALNFVSTISLFGGVTNLVWMQSTAFQTRVVEKEKALAMDKAAKQRANEDKERLRKEAEAECNAQKAKDVDALVRRRQAAYADHKKCHADWVKPYLMSTETAEQACLPKHKEFQQLVQSVKAREAKECPSAR